MQHKGVRTKIIWSEATCLPGDCCYSVV